MLNGIIVMLGVVMISTSAAYAATDAETRIVVTEVQTIQEAKGIVSYTMAGDENIRNVAGTDTSIEVTYRVPMKFLSFLTLGIPVRITAEMPERDAPAAVKVKFPWYRIFLIVPSEVSEESIRAAVSSKVDRFMTVDSTLDPHTSTEIALAIVGAMKKQRDAAADSIGLSDD